MEDSQRDDAVGVPSDDRLERGDDNAGPDKAPKQLRCRIGLHRWRKRLSDDGRPYKTCAICGDDEYNSPIVIGPGDLHH